MDPVTMFLTLAVEILKTAQIAMQEATVEQRKVVMDWAIKDIAWWRSHLGIDKTASS